MAGWLSVPWFVGGGAVHSAEVARVLAYAASGGVEGVVGTNHLAVRETVVPSTSIRVRAGACVIVNRETGGDMQSYVGMNDGGETIAVTATGSGSGRSDLVVARVEDPQYAPWTAPVDVTAGPYIFTRIMEDVPDDTVSAFEIDDEMAWIALARIDIPPSTATITNAMIHDLRQIARPRVERHVFTVTPGGIDDLSSGTFTDWPDDASWTVYVPPWANFVKIVGGISGASLTYGNAHGGLRAALGSDALDDSAWDGEATVADIVARFCYLFGGSMDVDESYRGTNQTIKVQAARLGGTVPLRADDRTFAYLDVEFSESPTND